LADGAFGGRGSPGRKRGGLERGRFSGKERPVLRPTILGESDVKKIKGWNNGQGVVNRFGREPDGRPAPEGVNILITGREGKGSWLDRGS